MFDRLEPASEHALHARFAGLLSRSARLLGGALQLWSPEQALLLALPEPPPAAALARIGEAAAQVVMRHELVRTATPREECLAVPVRARFGLAAILTLWRPSPAPGEARPEPDGASGEVTTAYLCDLARVLSQYLDLLGENASQMRELLAHRAQQQILREVRRRLALPADGRETLAFILEQARAATGAQLALLGSSDQPLLVAGDPAPARPGARIEPGLARELAEGAALHLRATRERIVQGDPETILPRGTPLAGPARMLVMALRRAERDDGFLALLRPGKRPFDRQEIFLLEALCEQIRAALRGGEAEGQRHAFLLSTVRALVSAIEAKDPHTSGHSTRVHLLSMLLGKELGLSAAELESLQWASILHDIGKIGMPEAILHKTTALTREEFEIVKTHPLRGYQVVQHIRPLQEAAQAVLLHHERYGGGGYPLGFAAEGIPRAARIIAVADTFDALTAARPYRRPCSEDEAFAEIARVRGTQLDPQVVDAFEKMLPFLRENLGMIAASIRVA